MPEDEEEPVIEEKITIEDLYEDDDSIPSTPGSQIPVSNISGVGKGTAEKIEVQGIKSVADLLSKDSKELAENITGVSEKMVNKWKTSAKALIS